VAGSRETHGFHAVVQNGPAASELSLPMRKTASWSGSLRPTEYKVAARMFVRDKRAPLDLVIPTTTSVLPCSELSRYGLASPERDEISERRPTLTAPARDSIWTMRVGAKKWAFKSNKEIGLKEKIACREFSA
jgi:hypothetical protein